MSGTLYARYVPSKTSQVSKTTDGLRVDEEVARSVHILNSKLYSRYVPPKASVRTNQTSIIESAESTSDANTEHGIHKRKRKDGDFVHKDREILIPALRQSEREAEALESSKGAKKRKSRDKKSGNEDRAKTTAVESARIDGTSGPCDADQDEKPVVDAVSTELRDKDDEEEEEEEINPAGVEAIFEKYRRSTQLAEADYSVKIPNKQARLDRERQAQAAADEHDEQPELHGLEPLPQPARTPKTPYAPSFDALPAWLAQPIVILPSATVSFSALNLSRKVLDNLHRKDFHEALAIQSGVLPLLLPGAQRYDGDICVSAPTGSGKTFAYILPMVENLKQKIVTRLRGVIIVPTRELVAQAREVAELCATGTGVKIGTAVGNVSLSVEQEQVVRRGQRFDPVAAKAMHKEADQKIQCGDDDVNLHNIIKLLPNHVPEYTSNIDILICTPGRLVDHIRSTTGFSLEHIEWMVIDEADKLLDQSFQDWVDVLLHALHPAPTNESRSARDRILVKLKGRPQPRRIQKIVLSATMTRDLSKLATLKFERPCLVSVGSEGPPGQDLSEVMPLAQQADQNEGFVLPSLLSEVAVPVEDGSDKPLYLLKILQDSLSSISETNDGSRVNADEGSDAGKVTARVSQTQDEMSNTILVFTNDSENATRLRHLLSILHPPLQHIMDTLAKSSATSVGRKTLSAFRSGRIKVLIASDRASRGLDIDNLSIVVNYDMPRSVKDYVHRVGRTARAGKCGKAWTLYTRPEARWFWKSVATGSDIRRGGRSVERVKIDVEQVSEDEREIYREALKKLQSAVQGRG